MSDFNGAALDAIFTTFSGIYNSVYEKTPAWSERVSTMIPSTQRENTYAFLARIPKMREWLGPRVIANAAAHDYTLRNKKFELTVEVKREDVVDNQLGLYSSMLVPQMADQNKKWPDQLMKKVIQLGTDATQGLGFDRVPFFSTTHPTAFHKVGSPTQSNNFTATALTAANYAITRQKMMIFNGDDGEPLNVMPNLLVVPPQLETTGKEILLSTTVPNAGGTASQTNIQQGTADLLVLPELGNEASTWYLMDVSKPLKPFIFQMRETPDLVSRTDPNDPRVFEMDTWVFGSKARGNAGYGLWFLASRNIA